MEKKKTGAPRVKVTLVCPTWCDTLASDSDPAHTKATADELIAVARQLTRPRPEKVSPVASAGAPVAGEASEPGVH